MPHTLRTKLFQEHTRLQMWLISRIVWYAAWIYIGSFVFFALLRLFTGVSIKRLGYFSLRHIAVHPQQGLEIRIGKLGIQPHRPTVARPGLVTFVVSNLEIVVDPEVIIAHEEAISRDDAGASPSGAAPAPAPAPAPSPGAAKADATGAAPEAAPFAPAAFDGTEFCGVPIFPARCARLAKIARWIVTHVRVFDVNVSSVSVVFTNVVTAVATTASVRLDLRKTLNYKRSNFVGTLDSYKLADNELPVSLRLGVLDLYTAESLEDESPWQVVEDLRLDVSSVLNLDTMRIKETAVHAHTGRFLLDVRYFAEIMRKIVRIRAKSRGSEPSEPGPKSAESAQESGHTGSTEHESERQPEHESERQPEHESEREPEREPEQPGLPQSIPERERSEKAEPADCSDDPNRANDRSNSSRSDSSRSESDPTADSAGVFGHRDWVRMMAASELFLHLINHVQITIGLLEFVRIPVVLPSAEESDKVMMAVAMKDLNVDVSRMNSKASGFQLLYDKNDLVHQLIFMLASLNIGLDNGVTQEEIVYIPMVTGLNRGNLFSQTLKFARSTDKNKVNHAQVRSRWAANAPTVSVEEHQLPAFVRLLMGALNQRREPRPEPRSHMWTKNDRYRSKISQILPDIDLEVVSTDGTGRLRCKDTTDHQNAIFIMSSERVLLAFKGTHSDHSGHRTPAFRACSTLSTTGAKVWYHSAGLSRFDIAAVGSTNLVVSVATAPQLEAAVDGAYENIHLNVLRHEIFSAMGHLHAALREPLEEWHKRHPGEQIAHENDAPVHRGGFLRSVPPLFSQIRLQFRDFSTAMASNHFRGQENDVLGLKFVTQSLEVLYQRSGGVELVESSDAAAENAEKTPKKRGKRVAPTDGRLFRVSGHEFVWYKADRDLLECRFPPSGEKASFEDEATIQQCVVAEIPELKLEMWTRDASHTEIDVCIRPRLKILFNINLILAFSVLKENINEVLLRFSSVSRRPKVDKQERAQEQAHKDAENLHDGDTPSDSRQASPPSPHAIDVRSNVALETNHVALSLPRALLKIDMPSDDQLMVELNQAKFDYTEGENPVLNTKGLRMYSKHPVKHEAWCILLSLVSVNVEYNLSVPEIRDKVCVRVDGFRVNVPYKFKLYRIIDNGITLAKAIKTLKLQTDELDTMIVLDPKRIEGVLDLPQIRVQAEQLLVSLEDDYFEADLTLAMLTQLEVVDTRLQKLYSFDTHLKWMFVLGTKVLEKVRALRHEREQSQDGGPDHSNHNLFATAFDFTAVSSRLMQLDDNLGDRVVKAALSFKRGASTVIDKTTKPHTRARSSRRTDSLGSDASSSAKLRSTASKATLSSVNGSGSHHTRSGSDHGSVNCGNTTNSESKTHAHSSDSDSDEESYLYHIAHALMDVPYDLIDRLLKEGCELGTTADDNDEAFTKGNAWLDFWSNPVFAKFRGLRMMLSDGSPGALSVGEARCALLDDFSRMWVDTIRHARMTQHYGVKCRLQEVVKDTTNPDTCKEEMIVGYSQKPLLMAMDMRKVDLTVRKTTHDTPEKLHQYMHDIGKGQPKDSEFSILIPFHIDLKAHEGLKVDIKDYPLPLLHFPGLARDQDPNTSLALRMVGDLVITEQLLDTKENIRRLFVPLKPLPKELRKKRGSDVIEVHRTLTPIKTFTNLGFIAGSTLPTRVSWCMAYKPGFHSVGESFSGFSKPPIDPSPTLGFWDKIRLIFHARLDFKFPRSSLALAMKAGKSPYGLLNSDSGFLFVWRENVHVCINPKDDPKNLFSFDSKRFQLLIPNYTAWESEFLNATAAERAFPRKMPFTSHEEADKVVFSFNQRTIWEMGMKFEKGSKQKFTDPDTGKESMMETRDAKFRPHYDVKLSLPEFIKDVESYDAYKGFRSDFIYMSISVRSFKLENPDINENAFNETNNRNNNAAHLTMGVIQHFKIWKDQFNGENWPPIKTGSLFPDPVRVRPSTRTFGAALSKSSYQIVLDQLDLSYFQHLTNRRGNSCHSRSTGLKAKMEHFAFDWHTRREPPMVQNEKGEDIYVELSGQRRWRMRSYSGQVRLKAVHLRVMEAKMRCVSTKQALRALNDVESDDSDDDIMEDDLSASDSESQSVSGASESVSSSPKNSGLPFGSANQHYGPRYMSADNWIDWDDFTEVGVKRRLRNRTPEVRVLPFIYSPEFCYTRNTDFSDKGVYVDPQNGDRFPKFGEVDVQSYHVPVELSGNVQARLLERRKAQLNERISELQASYDSLESDAGQKSPQQQKLMLELLGLLAVGKQNLDVLETEIEKYLSAASRDKSRLDELKERIAEDYQEALGNLHIPEKFERELSAKAETVETFARDFPGAGLDSSSFRNRYLIHAMHLKWDNSVRDLVYRLLYAFEEEKELNYVRCRPAVEYLEDLVARAREMAKENKSKSDRNRKSENGDADFNEENAEEESEINDDNYQEWLRRRSSVGSETYMSKVKRLNTKESYEERNHCNETPLPDCNGKEESCGSRLQGLFTNLKQVDDLEIAHKAHFVYMPTPRIQLISEENPTKCFQVIARNVELQAVDVYPKNANFDDESAKIERRLGATLNGANFFIVGEKDLNQPGVESLLLEPYSGEVEDNERPWPPWLVVELCYNPGPMRDFQVVKNVAFGVTLHMPNDLHVAENVHEEPNNHDSDTSAIVALEKNSKTGDDPDEQPKPITAPEGESDPVNMIPTNKDAIDESQIDETGIPKGLHNTLRKHGEHKGKAILTSIVIDAPKVLVELDSVQFYTLYTIVTDLLTYRDPLIKKREAAINRVVLLNDFCGNHLTSLNTIELLQRDIRVLFHLRDRLQVTTALTKDVNEESKLHLIKLNREILRRQTRLIVLIRAFKASLRRNMNTGVDKFTKISLLADGVDVRLLSEIGEPMMELILRRAHFSRLTNGEETSVNRATLAGFSARNLMKNSVYPQILANYQVPGDKNNEVIDAIKLKWTQLQRVGGIPVFDNVEVKLKPMHIQVEHGVFRKLLDFAFPITESTGNNSNSKDTSNGVDSHTAQFMDTDFGDSDSESSDSDVSVTLSELEREGSEEKVRSRKAQLRSKSGKKRKGLLRRLIPGKNKDQSEYSAGVDEMVNRASNFWSIRKLVIEPTNLLISYRGTPHSLLNIQNVHIKFPGFTITNKTWTKLDLILRIKKLGIKILLAQSGSIIGNMLKRHKSTALEDRFDIHLPALQLGNHRKSRDAAKEKELGVGEPPRVEDGNEHLVRRIQKVLLVPHHRRMAIEQPNNLREVTRSATINSESIHNDTSRRSSQENPRRSNSFHRSRSSSGYQEHTNKLRHPSSRDTPRQQNLHLQPPQYASSAYSASPPVTPRSPRPPVIEEDAHSDSDNEEDGDGIASVNDNSVEHFQNHSSSPNASSSKSSSESSSLPNGSKRESKHSPKNFFRRHESDSQSTHSTTSSKNSSKLFGKLRRGFN